MTAGTLSAVNADQGLPAADRADQHRGPVDQRRPRAQPEGARGGRGAGRRARRRHRPRPAARHPRDRQGQPRRGRHADHGGLASRSRTRSRTRTRPWWPSCAPRARSCSASQPVRVRELPRQRLMPSGYSLARRPGAEPVQRRHHAERLVAAAPAPSRPPAWRRSRSAPRRPARSSSPADGAGRSSACGPRSGSCRGPASCRSRATQDTAGPDDPHGRRRGRRARRDRRQGPGGPGHRHGARHRAGLPRRRSRPPRWPGKRIGVINNTNAQYTAAVAAIQALGATTVDGPVAERRAQLDSILVPGVQARPRRVLRRGCPRARR